MKNKYSDIQDKLKWNDIMFVCYILEKSRRITNNKIQDIIENFGKEQIVDIYEYADILHSCPIEEVAQEYIDRNNTPKGNVEFRETDPAYSKIAKAYMNFIIATYRGGDIVDHIINMLTVDFLIDAIQDYEASIFYTNNTVLRYYYILGKIVDEDTYELIKEEYKRLEDWGLV
jgi:hypothetical protein